MAAIKAGGLPLLTRGPQLAQARACRSCVHMERGREGVCACTLAMLACYLRCTLTGAGAEVAADDRDVILGVAGVGILALAELRDGLVVADLEDLKI